MSLLGNVIFHAFGAPYCFVAPLALVVIAVEAAVIRTWNWQVSIGTAIGCALGMNIVSYLTGFLLSPYLLVGAGLVVLDPDERGVGTLALGPDWLRLAKLAFLQAWAVSVILEVVALRLFRRTGGLNRIVVPVVIGNLVSYVIVYAAFLSIFGKVGQAGVE